jgi:transcriptional regulator with XRE-family HTH domain
LERKLLGQRIRAARENKNYSQEHLAELVSKDQRAISEIEAGTRRLAATDLPTFASALEVPLLYFFEGEMQKDDLDIAMLQVFDQISTIEVKKSAIEIVRILSITPTLSE